MKNGATGCTREESGEVGVALLQGELLRVLLLQVPNHLSSTREVLGYLSIHTLHNYKFVRQTSRGEYEPFAQHSSQSAHLTEVARETHICLNNQRVTAINWTSVNYLWHLRHWLGLLCLQRSLRCRPQWSLHKRLCLEFWSFVAERFNRCLGRGGVDRQLWI